jgi:hypothetical protein
MHTPIYELLEEEDYDSQVDNDDEFADDCDVEERYQTLDVRNTETP